MKKIIAVTAFIAAGIAHAHAAPGLPDNATEITPRDVCFQSLRGHADLAAIKNGETMTRIIEGAGGKTENGDFVCAAKFELMTDKGNRKKTPWRTYTVFLNEGNGGSKNSTVNLYKNFSLRYQRESSQKKHS
jgi:hypothetical protein